MKEIDESYLLEQRETEDAYTLVFYNIPNCQGCEQLRPIVESVENIFPDIEFVSLSVRSMKNISTFAPLATPSILLFVGGYRIREFNGIINDRYRLIDLIKEWVL